MPARQLHLVRHGEVHNPDRVLYGRLPGFRLSERGEQMAEMAAADLVSWGRPVARIIASPLQRTQESAAPISAAFKLAVDLDERIIEPTNAFEGKHMRGPDSALKKPANWKYLVNPFRPSWGEPYKKVVARMTEAMTDAALSVDEGDIVLVSHQLPIWVTHRHVTRAPLMHDPRHRRCALSSITSFEFADPNDPSAGFVEVAYANPAERLQVGAIDVGAV